MKNYLIWGQVINGQKRGKDLGFPTANIRLHKEIPHGVYVSQAKIHHQSVNYPGIFLPSVTFIGASGTFKDTSIFAECHILNFRHDIYGKWITIKLLKKIRNNIKFPSVPELTAQIKKDIEFTDKHFKLSSPHIKSLP